MEKKILVTYASTHGSTQQVAEFVAQVMREQGLPIDLQPARVVRSLEGYSAVVIGAPLYIFHMHKDAIRFLTRHQAVLSAMPVAVFAGGPFGKGDDEEWQEVQKEIDQELSKFPWLQPVSVEMIGGKFDPLHLRFPWNFLPAMKQIPANDLRDWEKIRAWANGLVRQLFTEKQVAA